MNFIEPKCNWDCNRIHKKWCNEHIRYIDFLVYISTKKTMFSHYRQITMHEKSKIFHPEAVDGIDIMIDNSIRLIKQLQAQIKEFHKKYRE